MASKLKTDILETVSGSGTIALTNQLSGMTSASMPSGSVLQVVQNYNPSAAMISSTSSTLVASGIQATITPKYANSLILVNYSCTMVDQNTSGGSGAAKMYLNGSVMAGATNYHMMYITFGHNRYSPISFNGQYTATSTSALTFEPYFHCDSGNNANVRFAHGNSSYALTLTEIKQ